MPGREEGTRRPSASPPTFFILTFLAGIAFIFFYAVWLGHVGNIDRRDPLQLHARRLADAGLPRPRRRHDVWVRQLMTTKEIVQERHELSSPPEEREVLNQYFLEGSAESGLGQRQLLRRTLLLASAPLGLLPLVLLRDLGPLPAQEAPPHRLEGRHAPRRRRHQPAAQGGRLQLAGRHHHRRARGSDEDLDEIAKGAVLLLNLPPELIKVKKGRENWNVGGIVAYSKICTHVGCPAACTSRPPTTSCARATSRPSTRWTARRSSSARPRGPCRSCRSAWTPRATSSPRATSTSRSARASGSAGGRRHEASKT